VLVLSYGFLMAISIRLMIAWSNGATAFAHIAIAADTTRLVTALSRMTVSLVFIWVPHDRLQWRKRKD
jgi:hypothetical protein